MSNQIKSIESINKAIETLLITNSCFTHNLQQILIIWRLSGAGPARSIEIGIKLLEIYGSDGIRSQVKNLKDSLTEINAAKELLERNGRIGNTISIHRQRR